MINKFILREKHRPFVKSKLWQNQKLKEKYQKIRQRPLTIIYSYPGSGKSATLAQFLQDEKDANFHFFNIKQVELAVKDAVYNIIYHYFFSENGDQDNKSRQILK
jgi:replication-associated recombination protein RarA